MNTVKMAENCLTCMSARPTPPTQTMTGSGPESNYSAQNRKKTKRSVVFDPKKIVVTPPKKKTMGFKWGGSRGVPTKNLLGDVFIGQNDDCTKVQPTIQPFGLVCANRPKNEERGAVCGVFPFMWACVLLI